MSKPKQPAWNWDVYEDGGKWWFDAPTGQQWGDQDKLVALTFAKRAAAQWDAIQAVMDDFVKTLAQ